MNDPTATCGYPIPRRFDVRIYRETRGTVNRRGGGGQRRNSITISGGTSPTRTALRVAVDSTDIALSSYGADSSLHITSITNRPTEALPVDEIAPTTATEWVRQNGDKLRRHAGRWVAITAEGIVAHSDDFDEVYMKARRRGISNPLVLQVPKAFRQPKVVSVKLK